MGMVRGCIIIIILFPGKTEPKGYGLYGVFVGGRVYDSYHLCPWTRGRSRRGKTEEQGVCEEPYTSL